MIPRVVVAGTQSGVGKTSVTLALARALARRGLRVQPFKVGPDFLDPTWLALACGRPCYNLDGWMVGAEASLRLFHTRAQTADVAIVEGVMGLFDGAGPADGTGSTAEMARMLKAPVLLVAGAHGMGRSLAALVAGYAGFEEGVRVGGVVANHCGSTTHGTLLAEALRVAALPPLVGAIPRGALPTLPGRHLGLVTADASLLTPPLLDALADAAEKHLDLDRILAMAREAGKPGADALEEGVAGAMDAGNPGAHALEDRVAEARDVDVGGLPREQRMRRLDPEPVPTGTPPASPAMKLARHRVRVGVASDAAFHFYYADHLEAMTALGADLVPFSPLADPDLPSDLDALVLGGGYPEEHAAALAANRGMRAAVRRFAGEGRPVYAECGGLMYLSRELRARDGSTHEMVGILPGRTAMGERRAALGYVELTLLRDSLWGAEGTQLRGHEFHYSEWMPDDDMNGWRPAYRQRHPRSGTIAPTGLERGNVLASYVHAHYGSRPECIRRFLQRSGGPS